MLKIDGSFDSLPKTLIQIMVNITSNILLSLIRIALHDSQEEVPLTSVDWKRIVQLAEKQGVLAIAFDGLSKLKKRQIVSIEKELLMEWFGQTIYMENVYNQHRSTIAHLAEFY